ncbi:MAG: SH3 domain-containing protein [Hyphomonadaceae bacterium]|nr:SH3 domain-containing protein [Hyphomonadaceae bacterium]
MLWTPLARTQEPVPISVAVSHVSGKPVPRFEALRYAAVNGRVGPSQDHHIAWRYERAGLPMLIIKETRDWRFVRDPDGDEVWVHARMLARADTAMVLDAAAVFSHPDAQSRALARLEPGAMVSLGRCEAGFCHVEAGRIAGWTALPVLWGAGLSEARPGNASAPF